MTILISPYIMTLCIFQKQRFVFNADKSRIHIDNLIKLFSPQNFECLTRTIIWCPKENFQEMLILKNIYFPIAWTKDENQCIIEN